MDLQPTQLHSFFITAQCSSFSSAAEQLFISHSALIQQMNSLEKALGFTLFLRTPKGIQLTESGRHFYHQAKRLSRQMDELVQECRRMEQKQSIIRVGNPGDLHTFYLYADLYRTFSQKYPSFSFEYVPTTRETVLDDCLSGRIDLGNYFDTAEHKKGYPLTFTPVQMELGVLLPENHPLSGRSCLTQEDLCGRDLYVSDISFHENIYEQVPALQKAILHSVDLSMDAIYRRHQENELFLLPLRFRRFFPSFSFVALEPKGCFYTEMVSRPDISPAAQKFLEFYLEYEQQND